MEYALTTKDLTKVYGKKAAVDKLNLKVRKGDIYGFIGKNGAGKSTTIKMVVGLARPTKGTVDLFEGESLKVGRAKSGTVIEYPALYPYMTARQNLEAQRILLGVKDKSVVDEVLEIVGLTGTGRKKAKNFSLGMKQRLAIALALIDEPEFLYLDEPINGLDPMGIKDMRDLLLKLNKGLGITILISSHILGELVKIATAYGVIDAGKLVAQFSADELKSRVRPKLKVKTNDNLRACDIFKSKFGITECSMEDDGTICIFDHLDESGKINSFLAENDIIVESISKDEGDYESYFIELMGGNNRA